MAAPFAEPLPPGTGELPEWLKEIEPTQAATPAAGVFAETLAPLPPPGEVKAAPVPAPAPGAGVLAPAQLPSWLQALTPSERPPAVAPAAEEPVETEGILAGLRGVLPAAAVAAQTLGVGISMRPQVEPNDLALAGTLQELIARGAAPAIRREGESRAQKLWSNTQRFLVFLVIAVVAIIPLIYSLGLVSAPSPFDTASANAMYDKLQTLKPDDPVLVAFDYEPTQSPEMDALACVVMRHLFALKAHVQVVSLYPAGPAAAQAMIDQLGRPMSDTRSLCGTVPAKGNVTSKGYVPGQATAVASIVGTTPISAVIELAATPDTLRWWAEQLAPHQDDVQLLAGVSASAEPMSRPYVESQQVKTMIAGVPGAIAYQFKLDPSSKEDQTKRQISLAPLESLALANAALVVLILLGGLIQLLSGRGTPSADERRRSGR
jgi:hypothetical protein